MYQLFSREAVCLMSKLYPGRESRNSALFPEKSVKLGKSFWVSCWPLPPSDSKFYLRRLWDLSEGFSKFRFGFIVLCWPHSQLLGFVRVWSVQMNSVYSYSLKENLFVPASIFCKAVFFLSLKPHSLGDDSAESLFCLQHMGGVIQYKKWAVFCTWI